MGTNSHELGYAVGIKRKGRVSKLMDFGAFIEIEPGIEGLAHISQLVRPSASRSHLIF